VLHLGRKNLLAPHLDALVRLLQDDQPSPRWCRLDQLPTPQAWTWGPFWPLAICGRSWRWDRSWMGSTPAGVTASRCQSGPLC
jgi:hypothetical protein